MFAQFTKYPREDLKNVRTVSILTALSKIYEKLTRKLIAINVKFQAIIICNRNNYYNRELLNI